MHPEMIELKAEVEALRKQNHDLTEALLAFFTKGGLQFNVKWSDEAMARNPALSDIAHRNLVKQAVALVESKLGDRAAVYRQNSLLKGYAMNFITDRAALQRLHGELYDNQR